MDFSPYTVHDGRTLSGVQMRRAAAMVGEVAALKLPRRAAVVVLETALVESFLTIYANSNVPESLKLPHEAVGNDHRSVGVLQQQTPSWGSAADCMDSVKATGKFLLGAGVNPGLTNLPGYRYTFVNHPQATNWQQLPTGAAAQAVQVSAFPDRYQAWEADASALAARFWPTTGGHPMAMDADVRARFDALEQEVGKLSKQVQHLASIEVWGDPQHQDSLHSIGNMLRQVKKALKIP